MLAEIRIKWLYQIKTLTNTNFRASNNFSLFAGHYFAVRLKDPKTGSHCLAGLSLCPRYESSDCSLANHEKLARKFTQHKDLSEGMNRM